MDGLKPAIDALTGFGTAAPAIGLLLWLYWQERTERKEMVGKVLQLTADMIEAEQEMTQAVSLLSSKIVK